MKGLGAVMVGGEKNFHKIFAVASLGFVLLAFAALPCPAESATSNSTVKHQAASSQFARAEELRALLNGKAPDQRTLSEYKKVVAGYQRVYLITPRAPEVPESLVAVAELNTEMGDRFGRSYYQSAADAYSFLIREYPASKHVQEAMLRLAKLQKDQLGDAAAATKTFQEFQKKYPHSAHKREVQEAIAELALLKSAETGEIASKNPAGPPAPVAAKSAPPATELRGPTSGGEPAKFVAVPHVQKIRTNVNTDSTEIIIDLEDSVQFASGRIANPDRIYFDLHKARLSPAVARGEIHVSGDLLTKIRVAQNQAGVVRVVLDVHGVVDYAVSLTKKPTRLVIELYSSVHQPKKDAVEIAGKKRNSPSSSQNATVDSMPAATEVAVAQPATQTNVPAKPPANSATAAPEQIAAASDKPEPAPKNTSLTKPGYSKSKNKPDLVQPVAAPPPTRDGQSTLTRALGLKISRIVIDPGHGGHDTGTIGPTGLMEKDLCLDVALRLGKILQQKLPGADIVYTRSDDTFIPLEDRTRIANEAKADLFVSIHANSSPDHGARGVETYYLNLKGSPEAMEVAARENAASDQGVHDLEDLVKKIARTEKIDESKELAEDVQESLSKRIQHSAKPVRNRGVRKAPFVVLIGADMPSILTEISFLSNAADEQLLKKPEHRQRIAEGVYQGVAAYLQSLNSVAVNTSGRPHTAVVSTVEQTRNQK
ncbi:MAG TPA: N-acetylmuramoyl-L-alanine amidase [Candidatus Sulfotelmatobacter sp.]|nr:N-acetylmuramoyl-L-alanine amidase [Candidatus Sulfotelmatobacter sp.]